MARFNDMLVPVGLEPLKPWAPGTLTVFESSLLVIS